MARKPKLLIIGVDAGSPDLFEQWARSGDMPNLARLLDQGVSGTVRNPFALEAGSVWPVFYTGLLPGHQPQYDGRRVFDPTSYTHRWYDPEETSPPFWRYLSERDVRCLLVDPPYARLDPAVNGTMIVDWGTHVPADGQRFEFQSHPEGVAREVLDAVGGDPAEGVSCDRMAPESIDDFRRFRDIYLERIARKGTLATKMLRERTWDLALVVSSDLHCTGHHLWHINHKAHPRYSPTLEAALGEPLRECYRAFDATVGDMLAAVDDDTTVMLFGSHGMGPQYTGTGLLDRILVRLERGRPARHRRSLKGSLRRLWHRVPADTRARLRPLRKPFQGTLHPPTFLGNRENRRFFEVYANNASGGIRINLQGREASGKVALETFAEVAAYLKRELEKIVNVDTGEPLVESVIITREHYDGAYLDRLPDLLVRWNRGAPIESVQSEAIGVLSQESVNARTGDHTPEGMYIIRDPAIRGGVRGQEVAAEDFAPTITNFFGRPMRGLDGNIFDLPPGAPRRRA